MTNYTFLMTPEITYPKAEHLKSALETLASVGYEIIDFRPIRHGDTFLSAKTYQVKHTYETWEGVVPRYILQKNRRLVITYREIVRMNPGDILLPSQNRFYSYINPSTRPIEERLKFSVNDPLTLSAPAIIYEREVRWE